MAGSTFMGRAGAVWGIIGVSALLGSAIYRLTPMAMASFAEPLSAVHYLGYAFSLFFMGYTEGYKAFQKQFSPRIPARARYIATNPTWARVLLAPLFCMGFFHATKKRLIVTWSLSFGIVGLIILVGRVPQPWRGILDLGVVVALAWGLVAMWVFALRAMKGHHLPVPSDVPTASAPAMPEAI